MYYRNSGASDGEAWDLESSHLNDVRIRLIGNCVHHTWCAGIDAYYGRDGVLKFWFVCAVQAVQPFHLHRWPEYLEVLLTIQLACPVGVARSSGLWPN